ncbi:PREDICTED: brain-specific homeobox protein homolog [Myotis brandtii]|uniref:brain-specific homeobox protein homolog n=1 Tax=Myotis brandtii TaxID=109478 RepID=UPI0007044C7A|nr:PREDICTED: brain-specific homeobox protein homolog [Myotis brandtii]
MNLNFTSPLHPASSQRPTSFFIEDILLHKPKPLREVPPDHFASSLASRVPLLDYGYPLMPTPTLLAPHPHHPLHKGDHHHPYFLTTSVLSLLLASGSPAPKHCDCRPGESEQAPAASAAGGRGDTKLPPLSGSPATSPGTFIPAGVKTWFQNRRMKHKKQLRKSQDEPKIMTALF